ncbi:MAG: hypothetical protein U0599_26785 [Vicinamibacteria bacterium]
MAGAVGPSEPGSADGGGADGRGATTIGGRDTWAPDDDGETRAKTLCGRGGGARAPATEMVSGARGAGRDAGAGTRGGAGARTGTGAWTTGPSCWRVRRTLSASARIARAAGTCGAPPVRASTWTWIAARLAFTSRTSSPRDSASSTFDRIARWRSSSETGLTSGPTWPG